MLQIVLTRNYNNFVRTLIDIYHSVLIWNHVFANNKNLKQTKVQEETLLAPEYKDR